VRGFRGPGPGASERTEICSMGELRARGLRPGLSAPLECTEISRTGADLLPGFIGKNLRQRHVLIIDLGGNLNVTRGVETTYETGVQEAFDEIFVTNLKGARNVVATGFWRIVPEVAVTFGLFPRALHGRAPTQLRSVRAYSTMRGRALGLSAPTRTMGLERISHVSFALERRCAQPFAT